MCIGNVLSMHYGRVPCALACWRDWQLIFNTLFVLQHDGKFLACAIYSTTVSCAKRVIIFSVDFFQSVNAQNLMH